MPHEALGHAVFPSVLALRQSRWGKAGAKALADGLSEARPIFMSASPEGATAGQSVVERGDATRAGGPLPGHAWDACLGLKLGGWD
jgi:hypothetical protein